MTAVPADGAAHLVVDDLDEPAVDDDGRHHLRHVLRLADGDRLTATDGAGCWRWCRLVGDRLQSDGEPVAPDRPVPPVTIAFALTKGAKPELSVQKLTELGVDRIIPFRAARSVIRWDDEKAAAAHARWSAIARTAVMQSRGCWLPAVEPLAGIDDVVAAGAARLDRGGRPPTLDTVAVAVGPEGGWDPAEVERLPTAVGLGPNVLRAETAAITAGGVLTAMRSGMVAPAADSCT